MAWLFLSEDLSLTGLGMASLYGLFVELIAVFLLCYLRRWIARLSRLKAVFSAIFLLTVSVVIVELCNQYVFSFTRLAWIDLEQLLARSLAALILAGIVVRFFMLLELFDLRSKAEAEAKVSALQSRIQPHFLFNSLNTISELAATNPQKAEEATTALAALFRASLENERKSHSLSQEIELCRRYLELERFRMQDKLNVVWQVSIEQTKRWKMPKLILQPLIENALLHGLQKNGEALISIDFKETNSHLSLMIENKVGNDTVKEHSGHGIGVDNIRQRLMALYDDQFTFRSKEVEGVYSVLLRIPKQRYVAEVIG